MNTIFFRMCCLCIMAALCSPLSVLPTRAAVEHGYELELILEGQQTIWGMDFISPTDILFTEKNGNVFLLNTADSSVTAISGAPPVRDLGQGGLLDIKVGPEFKTSGWLYFTYSKPVERSGVTTLARAKIDRDQNRLTEWQDLLVTTSATGTSRHFGSRIAFAGTDYLFFTVGDRGERPTAQDLTNHCGTVIRLHLDGSIPADNPFVKRSDALPEIYSYGHRNPQGIAFDAKKNNLWLIEHGPRGGDEINLVLPGRNYGWPVVSHGKEYFGPFMVGEATEKEGMENPRKVYTPSIAPASLILYTGESFPQWKNSLLAGALKLRHLNIVTIDNDDQVTGEYRILEELNERIRALIQGPEGNIYFSTDSGKIFRLRKP